MTPSIPQTTSRQFNSLKSARAREISKGSKAKLEDTATIQSENKRIDDLVDISSAFNEHRNKPELDLLSDTPSQVLINPDSREDGLQGLAEYDGNGNLVMFETKLHKNSGQGRLGTSTEKLRFSTNEDGSFSLSREVKRFGSTAYNISKSELLIADGVLKTTQK